MKKGVKKPRKHLVDMPIPIENAQNPKVSVIIPAMNEHSTIAQVISEARNVHPDTEVIVVVNGSEDGTESIARRMGAKVLSYKSCLGHDVGRAIGAAEAKGDIILFTDADFMIPAEKLVLFVQAVEQGIDIALNSYQGDVTKQNVHHVVLSKQVLNRILDVPELGSSSMTAVPHAISRRALEMIGAEQLAIPPKAQAIAVQKGLKLVKAAHVNVASQNPIRKTVLDQNVKNLVVGDHLEAIYWWIEQIGDSRATLHDLGRRREQVRDR